MDRIVKILREDGLLDDCRVKVDKGVAKIKYNYWELLPAKTVRKLRDKFDVNCWEEYDEDTGYGYGYDLKPL